MWKLVIFKVRVCVCVEWQHRVLETFPQIFLHYIIYRLSLVDLITFILGCYGSVGGV